MSVSIPIAVAGGSADGLSIAPNVGLLLLILVAVVAVIYAQRPPFTQFTAWVFVPWIVVGSILPFLVTYGRYPPYLVALLTQPGAYLTGLLIPGVAWMFLLVVSKSRQKRAAFPYYVGAMGIGTVTILGGLFVLHLGESLPRALVFLTVIAVALLATVVVTISIGLWSPDFIEYTVIAGSFVVFGILVNGIATGIAVVAAGSPRGLLSAGLRDLASIVAGHGAVGVGETFLWVWLLLVVNIGIGVSIVTLLAPYARTNSRAVHAVLGLSGAFALVIGLNDLLLIVVGSLP